MKLKGILAVLLTAIPFILSAQSSNPEPSKEIFPFPIHKQVLNNGLTIIIVPFDSPEVVTVHIIVRAGSRDDVEPGRSGFAHFFEHMMFNGTPFITKTQFQQMVLKNGISNGAETTEDYTVFYSTLPTSGLDALLQMEADRFQNLTYTEPVFRLEASAVHGEYLKETANQMAFLQEQVRLHAFTTHPYRYHTMGLEQDIITLPDQYAYSIDFYNRYYRPENTVILMVGDLNPPIVAEKINRTFGLWASGYTPSAIPPEPMQTEPEQVSIQWPTDIQTHAVFSYKSPAFTVDRPDFAALDFIGRYLTWELSDLHSRLVGREQKLDMLNYFFPVTRDPGLWYLVMRFTPGTMDKEIINRVNRQMEILAQRPLEPATVEIIKNRVLNELAMKMTSTKNIAQMATPFISATGTLQSINDYFSRYSELTAEDIQKAAARYLVPQKQTIITMTGPTP